MKADEDLVGRRMLLSMLGAGWMGGAFGLTERNLAALFGRLESSGNGEILNLPEPVRLSVFDYREAARRKMPAAHWGYLETGVVDDATVRANRDGYDSYAIRARRLVDSANLDTRVSVFGELWPSPVALCPIGSQRAFASEGEIATARAARRKNCKMMLSTASTTSIEDVIAERGAPVWFQLYTTSNPEVGMQLLRRAETAGADAIVLTVDETAGGMLRETEIRSRRDDNRDCNTCHKRDEGVADFIRRKPMFSGIKGGSFEGFEARWMTWDFIKRIRERTKTRLILKGIMTAEDAIACIEIGVDGIIVSNHGGRAEESLFATVDALPEIAEVVSGRMPILLDGGIRRGQDIFKALALGATAVAIGRPYIWGLNVDGQVGIEAIIDILNKELRSLMGQVGVRRICDISQKNIRKI